MQRHTHLAACLTLAVTVSVPLTLIAQTPPAPTPTPSVVQSQRGAIAVERLAQLEHPWGMTYLPDGRLLVTEKPGRLRVFANGSLSEPIGGVPDVAFKGQGGLADVVLDPDFASNNVLYLSYAEAAERQPPNARDPGDPRVPGTDTTDVTLKGLAVARARLDGNRLQDVRVIWRQNPKTIGRGHFGGRMVFGTDGKLYITSSDRMRFDPAQDSAGNVGKIVRINPDGSIPADNPLARVQEASHDVWTLGHRNPLGLVVEPGTGRLWAHEMGPLGGDELNLIQKGQNYGWPEVSNGDNYDGSHIPDHPTSQEFVRPIHTWTPVISPSGLIFYTADLFPAWRGSMLLGGLSSQSLIRVTLRENRLANEERIYIGKRIRDVEQAPDGAVLLVTDGPDGELLRLTPQSRPGGGGADTGSSAGASAGAETPVATTTGLSGPEAVRYDPDQDVFFVANFNGAGDARDNNGFISRVRPDGTVDSMRFIAGGARGVTLHAPRGMFIVGDTLWVADVDAVRAFDRRTGAPVASVDFAALDPGFLNDVAVGPDGAVYVTDTPNNRIYRIAGRRATVALEDSALDRPNGITWDGVANRFIVVPFGGSRRLLTWRPGEPRLDSIPVSAGGRFDGVEVLPDGSLLVASQADSSLYIVRPGEARRLTRTSGAPADIGVDVRRGLVAVPYIRLNTVDYFRLPGDR